MPGQSLEALVLTSPGICDVATTISAFGPLISYAFIAYVPIKWRAVYWFAFSIEFFACCMVFLFYKPPSFNTKHGHEGKSKLALLRQLDFFGLFLFTSGLTLLLIGITWVCSIPNPAKSANPPVRAVANGGKFLVSRAAVLILGKVLMSSPLL